MLRIAICDDEKLFRENIKKYVLKYLSEKDISSEIDMFNSGKELLGLGTDLLGYNIIFLDINMDEIDGIMTPCSWKSCNRSPCYAIRSICR